MECLQSRTVLASSGVPACKDRPVLQGSNSGVTAHLAWPDLEQLHLLSVSAGGSLSTSISYLTLEAPKIQVAIITPWGQINSNLSMPILMEGGLSLVEPRIRRVLGIQWNPREVNSRLKATPHGGPEFFLLCFSNLISLKVNDLGPILG